MTTLINDKTYVPLVYATIVVAALAGGIIWLTEIRSLAKENSHQISKLEATVISINQSRAAYRSRLWGSIRSQDLRLARIEGKLDVLLDGKKK